MTLVADIPRKPASALSPGRDPRIAVAETWLCMLSALAEIGVRFLSFVAHVVAPSRDGPKTPMMAFRLFGDPATTFERVARAVRLAVALALRIEDELAASRGGKPLDLDAFVAQAPCSEAARITDLPEPVREPTGLGDEDRGAALEVSGDVAPSERAQDLDKELDEALREDKAFYRLLKGPLKDAVAAICADLGLKPDWSLWAENGFPQPAGGGEEDWIDFFVRERDMGPAPGSDGLPPTPPPPPPPPRCDRPDGEDKARRPGWPPPDRHDRSPPHCLADPRPPDRPVCFQDPEGRTLKASLMSSTIIAGAPWAAERRRRAPGSNPGLDANQIAIGIPQP